MSLYFSGLRTERDDPSGWLTFGRVDGPPLGTWPGSMNVGVEPDRRLGDERRVEAVDRDRVTRAAAESGSGWSAPTGTGSKDAMPVNP